MKNEHQISRNNISSHNNSCFSTRLFSIQRNILRQLQFSPTPTPAPTASTTPTPAPTATPHPRPHSNTANSHPNLQLHRHPPPPPLPPVTLTVFAASSLANVIANMTTAFDKQYNCNIVVNSGSSSTLEQQIVAGSPCDVFMSADIKWTNTLNSSKLIIQQHYNTNFTTNSLCVIIAPGNPKNITSLADLASKATGANKIHIVIAADISARRLIHKPNPDKNHNTWGNPS